MALQDDGVWSKERGVRFSLECVVPHRDIISKKQTKISKKQTKISKNKLKSKKSNKSAKKPIQKFKTFAVRVKKSN